VRPVVPFFLAARRIGTATYGEQAGMAKTDAAGFKRLSRWLVIALAVVVALVSYNVTIPSGRSSASNWRFVATHPTILLHVIVATVILVMAVVLLILAIRKRNQSWIVLSVIGLAFVLLAFASGEDYVMTLRKSSLDYMSIGWLGAIVTYGIGWYLGRKKSHQEQDVLVPGS
jgi:mannose/fructose/N-acetylgalactosamine-specific phosphotransferase system component IID